MTSVNILLLLGAALTSKPAQHDTIGKLSDTMIIAVGIIANVLSLIHNVMLVLVMYHKH